MSAKKKKILFGIVIVAVICAAAYFSGIIVPSANSAEDTAIAALEAYLEFDSEETLSLFHEKYTDWAAEKYYRGDRDGFEEMLKNKSEENERYYTERYGKAWSYSDVKVSKVYNYPDSQIDALNEDYEALGLDLKVKAAQKIKLKYTLSYLSEDDRKIEESAEYEAFLIKVGTKWYLCDE